jgi:hypothetical protein
MTVALLTELKQTVLMMQHPFSKTMPVPFQAV